MSPTSYQTAPPRAVVSSVAGRCAVRTPLHPALVPRGDVAQKLEPAGAPGPSRWGRDPLTVTPRGRTDAAVLSHPTRCGPERHHLRGPDRYARCVPWFRRRHEEPPPATRADVARVERVLVQLSEQAARIQHDIGEVNGRLERSEQGLSTYTYAVRSLSLRLVELDDKLAAGADDTTRAIDDMQGHLRAFELRLPKTRQHDPDDPERPVTLEELEDARLDARQATKEATAVVTDLRAELARAMVELQALQARTSPPPPPPPGWTPPAAGTGWTADDAVSATLGHEPAAPADGAEAAPVPGSVDQQDVDQQDVEPQHLDPQHLEPLQDGAVHDGPLHDGPLRDDPLHDDTAEIPRTGVDAQRDVA